MILHQAFRETPLDRLRPDPADFSPAEERYFAAVAHPEGSRAARALAKVLLGEWLEARDVTHTAKQLEVLSQGAGDSCDTGVALAATGPPEFRLPAGLLPEGCRLHLSLSHSRTHAAALLVVEGELDSGPGIARGNPRAIPGLP